MKVKKSTKSQESVLRKAVKNVKQILEEKDKKLKIKKNASEANKLNLTRGVVYIGHIPHGFYEEQMREFFKQFGVVTQVRVARSRKTGRSRGYGYIEFLHSDVAKVAAETMNNYLMYGRLLKATYIPPEQQHNRYFIGKPWTYKDYPGLKNRRRDVEMKNANMNAVKQARSVRKTVKRLSTLEKKLEARGIDFTIKPVDVPKTK